MSWLEHTTVKNLVYFHQKLGKKCTFFYCSAKYKKRETGKWVGGNRVYGEVQFQLNRHCASRNYQRGHQTLWKSCLKSILCPNFAFAQTCIIAEPPPVAGYSAFLFTHVGRWLEGTASWEKGVLFPSQFPLHAHLLAPPFPNPVLRAKGQAVGILSSTTVPLSIQIKWMGHSIPHTPGKWEWDHGLQRKKT